MNEDRTNSQPLRFVSDLEESTVHRIISVLVGLAGVLLVLGLVAMLPAVGRIIGAVAVSPITLLVAVATLLIVGALLVLAPAVRLLVTQTLAGPDEIVAPAAASAMYLVVFVAVGVAYNGFAGAVTPLFDAFGIGGLYHLGFLLTGLLVLVPLTQQLYRCWKPVTDLLTTFVTDAFSGGSPTVSTTDDHGEHQ